MSAEATLAVMEHASGTDTEKWTLLILGNSASHDGVVAISRTELADRIGKTERAAAQIVSRLRNSGQLMQLEEGGGRGRVNVYWLNLPGIPEPELRDLVDPTPENPEKEGNAAPEISPKPDGRSISSKTTTGSSSSKEAKEKEFLAATTGHLDPDLEAEAEILEDGLAFLREGRKTGNPGKVITPAELAIAAACIAAFNRCFEWKGKSGSDYGLGANLTSIVERARQRPSWDVGKHVRLVESAWRVRWWERNGAGDRRPHPNVIYGAKSFDNVVQDAADEAAGEAPAAIKKRRYTRG